MTLLIEIVVASGVGYLLAEMAYRNVVRRRCGLFLFYSESVHPKPNTRLSFRLYGENAQLLLSSDCRLNNLGYFSDRDYQYEKGTSEFRIIVLGQEQTASSVADRSWPDYLEEELNNDESLRRHLGKVVRVFNLAWPDAGFAHYAEYWKTRGKLFAPDFVIVNITEYDYPRGLAGAPLTYRGQPIHGYQLHYSVGDTPEDTVRINVCGTMPGLPLSDPRAIAPRPFACFASRTLLDNPSKIKLLQDQVSKDYLAGAERKYSPWLLERIVYGRHFGIERNFDPLPQHPVDVEALVERARKHLREIVDDHPNVILIHNANWAEIFPNRVSFKWLFRKSCG